MNDAPKFTRLEPYEPRVRLFPYVGQAWLPVCRSAEVGVGKPRAERFAGFHIVLFRDADGIVRALEDRCPHRGVPLSLGECQRGRIVCAYHGLEVGGNGQLGNLRVRSFAAREDFGLVWVYAGDAPDTSAELLPKMRPFLCPPFVHTTLQLDMRSHSSLVLDNGVDLTHAYLHRDQPFFFKILSLGGIVEETDSVEVWYRAELRNEFNRRREGPIRIGLSGNLVRLDFDGQPVIHSVLTPRSANGRELTQWWFVSFRANRWLRFCYRLFLPYVRRVMLAAFQQDRLMLEHEAEAVFVRKCSQTERNPLVRDVEVSYRQRLEQRYRMSLSSRPMESMLVGDLLGLVDRGELAVLDSVAPSPLTHEELKRKLGDRSTVGLRRDWAIGLLEG